MSETVSKILLCTCDGSMRFDMKALGKALGSAVLQTHSQLCRAQIDAFKRALSDGGPLRIACTQEAPLFLELAEQTGAPAKLSFVNIRERAGWADEGDKAAAKIAALLAEAELTVPPGTLVSMQSRGRLLILGDDDVAIETARRLSDRLDVSVVLSPQASGKIIPPSICSFPIFFGTVGIASGHFGDFTVSFTSLSPAEPSSRGGLGFGKPGKKQTLSTDLIVDLRGQSPLFPAPQSRDGYIACAADDPVHIERALFDLSNMVGTFDKPRYVHYAPDLCAHGRNAIVGCHQCLDVCSTGAITPDGDHVAVNPYICAGCGDCAGVCPTGAIEYTLPSATTALARLRVLMQSYAKAGGKAPRILIHDRAFGDDVISLISRTGRGLPASVIPFAVNEVAQSGIDILLGALAHGARRVLVLAPPHKHEGQDGLRRQIALGNEIVSALGYGEDRLHIIDSGDPDTVEAQLYQDVAPKTAKRAPPGGFSSFGKKRHRLRVILEHLHEHAPTPIDVLPLAQGAPFGNVVVEREKCTLCLSCVNACPTAALSDNPDTPQLNFREANCIQCGLCRTSCPEDALTLHSRLDFTRAALTPRIVNEEEPFACIRCAKPFGVRSSIERMIEKMQGHTMFAEPGALNRLRMCDQCRVIDLATSQDNPWTSAQRRVKTTDDYLAEREHLRRQVSGRGPESADGEDI